MSDLSHIRVVDDQTSRNITLKNFKAVVLNSSSLTNLIGDVASGVQPGDNISVLTNDANYQVRVVPGTTGDLAALDANGDIIDSGLNASDFATPAQGITADSAVQPGDNISVLTNDANYQDRTVPAITNNFAALDASGDIIDGGSQASSFATPTQGATADSAVQPSDNVSVLINDANYQDRTVPGTSGDYAALDVNGDIIDSGARFSDFATPAQGATADAAMQPDSTVTFTNKTIDANATGNAISNIDVADLANGTDGELITWDASGVPDTVAVGTAGQVLTSGGVGVAPTMAAPTLDYELLVDGTVTNSANLTFTDLSANYDYRLVFTNIVGLFSPSSLIHFNLHMSTDNGSSFKTGLTDYRWINDGELLSSPASTPETQQNWTGRWEDDTIQLMGLPIWNTYISDQSMTVDLIGMMDTNTYAKVDSMSSGLQRLIITDPPLPTLDFWVGITVQGQFNTVGATDAVRFSFEVGNIVTLTYKMYRIRVN